MGCLKWIATAGAAFLGMVIVASTGGSAFSWLLLIALPIITFVVLHKFQNRDTFNAEVWIALGRTCSTCPRFQGSGGLSYCPRYRSHHDGKDPSTVTCQMWGHS